MATVIQYPSGMSNGFLVVDRAVIAVDSGAELGAEHFTAVLEQNGIAPHDIKLLVVSHAHVDHFVNMDEMRKLTGAPILVHKDGAAVLREAQLPQCFARNAAGERVEAFRVKMTALHGERVPYLPPMEPDLLMEDDFDLSPYGVDGKIIFTPGHSYTCTSVVLADGQAITGDIIVDDEFTDGVPTIAYYGCHPDRQKANALLFPSCQRLLDAGVQTLYSGYGGPFTRAQFEQALKRAKQE